MLSSMLKWFVQHQRRVFIFLFIPCFFLVLIQYRYSYFSTAYCTLGERSVHQQQSRSVSSINVYKNITIDTKIVKNVTTLLGICQPQKYVLFLKTHKTGSSTITNILNRYADKHNMSILLPKGSGYYSFDWPNKYRLSFSMSTFTRPNFLANHARYSRKSMNIMFPRESTTYISVLRHPVSQWESTFQYMSFPYILDISDKKDPLDYFLNNPPTTENIIEISRRFPSLYLLRNPLFFDLGLDYKHYDNATFIRRALKTLDEDFELVLIMEHFDESLTLLRRRLCWDIDDVVYFKMNERLNKHKRRVLTEEQIEKIKSWNNADVVLYNYFVEKFWREVKNEGPGFYDDVLELRRRKDHYSKLCIERDAIEEAYSSVFVKGYKMRGNLTGETKIFCERMLKNEIHYMDYFRANRVKWMNKIEGINIQNFEESTKEMNIFVETSNIKISNVIYGRPKPTKKTRHQNDVKEHQNDVKERQNDVKERRNDMKEQNSDINKQSRQSNYSNFIINNNSRVKIKKTSKQNIKKTNTKTKLKNRQKTTSESTPPMTDEIDVIDTTYGLADDNNSNNLMSEDLKYDGKTIVRAQG